MDKKLKNKIKRIINKSLVDCFIRYSQDGNYKDYQFYGNKSRAIKEAKRWIWLQYQNSKVINKQVAIQERKQNLACLKVLGLFDCENKPAYLLYKLDIDNLISLGFNNNVIKLAEELKEKLISKYNESYSLWRLAEIEAAMDIINNVISEVKDKEKRQELIDNKEAVAMALVLLCSYFDYSDLKIKKKVNR